MDPETVKEVIARQTWSENRRRNVANAYNLYANKYGIKWEKPARANILLVKEFLGRASLDNTLLYI